MRQRFIIFFSSVLFINCSDRHPAIAVMKAKACIIKPFENGFYINKMTFFSNDSSVNKLQMTFADAKEQLGGVNLCNLLELKKIDFATVNLINVTIQNNKNE